MPDHNSDWVIVSGANGSIGRAIVDHFLARERPVLGLDRKDDPSPSPAKHPRLTSLTVDLASESEAAKTVDDAIPRSDRIGLLVNAVGLIRSEPVIALHGAKFQAHSLKSWHEVMEANLTAAFVLAAHVAARMARKGGGAIVNFSSIAGRGNAGQVAYSTAKAGIEGLTRAMASELGPIGIRVNAIAPGFIDVVSTHAALPHEQLQVLKRQTPLRRLGALEEIVGAVDFLAENGFVNGVVLDIDGGLRL